MADITAEWVIGIEDATGGHPYGPGGSNHTGQALLNINSTWNEYLGAYHSERRSIREQYGNWGDTPMKDVMENVYELEVPLKVDINYGKNWFEAK